MNRIAALLASLLTASVLACGPAPAPYTDLTFYWQFQDWDGNTYGNFTSAFPGCDVANVDRVVVTLWGPGGYFQTMSVPCVAVNGMPGATFTALPVGAYSWSLEGRRQGLTVFSDTGPVEVVDFPVVGATLQALYPNMDLYFQEAVPGSCFGATELRFALQNFDSAVVEYSSVNAYVPFASPSGFTMPSIPVSTAYGYGYRYISAVDSNGFSVCQVCQFRYPPNPILQTSTGVSVSVALPVTTGICP